MKTQPNPSDRGVLAGLVERVTYQNAENGHVARALAERHYRRTRSRLSREGIVEIA